MVNEPERTRSATSGGGSIGWLAIILSNQKLGVATGQSGWKKFQGGIPFRKWWQKKWWFKSHGIESSSKITNKNTSKLSSVTICTKPKHVPSDLFHVSSCSTLKMISSFAWAQTTWKGSPYLEDHPMTIVSIVSISNHCKRKFPRPGVVRPLPNSHF